MLGGHTEWADNLYTVAAAGRGGGAQAARMNALVAGHLAKGWAAPLAHAGRREPEEGEGVVTYDRFGTPTATARVEGEIHRVSAVCPHLGGVLRWNDAERSWDCPLHGSRFTPCGERLEGPATLRPDPAGPSRDARASRSGWSRRLSSGRPLPTLLSPVLLDVISPMARTISRPIAMAATTNMASRGFFTPLGYPLPASDADTAGPWAAGTRRAQRASASYGSRPAAG